MVLDIAKQKQEVTNLMKDADVVVDLLPARVYFFYCKYGCQKLE